MKFLLNNILSLSIAVIIAIFSFMSPNDITRINIFHIHNIDKIVHASMYFFLTITINFENRRKITKPSHWFITGIIPLFYGITIEFLQPVITQGRTMEFADILFNISGILLGIIIWLIISHRK